MKLDHKKENLILQKVTGLSKEQLFLKWENLKLTSKQKQEYQNFISRLKKWEPIEYIIEKANFYGIDFFVDSRVLIPRDDTEIMVKNALKQDFDILIDIWTGSSCIAISILKNKKQIEKCFVVDISKKALEVSKINIKKHKLEEKIESINDSLLDNFEPKSKQYNKNLNLKNVVITANLPYIKNWDFENIDKKTLQFEPETALYWWENTGFELYEKIIVQALEFKKIYNIKKLTLFIEIGFDQRQVCKNFLKAINIKFNVFKDILDIDRCFKLDL